MEDISGDQWEHFAAVSRNDPVTQDFSIQQHSPARSETAPLGPDDRAGGACARLRVCLPAFSLWFINEWLQRRGASTSTTFQRNLPE